MTQPVRRSLTSGSVISLGLIIGGLMLIAALAVARLLPGAGDAGQPLDLALRLDAVAQGLDSPVLLTGAGDGSGDRYVVEQPGTIRRLDADGSIDEAAFLDIVDRVRFDNEQGLLGLAFHPAFEENGRLFVAYSRREDGATTISEFTLPGALEPGGAEQAPPEPPTLESTERPLLVIAQPYTTHKGGMLAFDADGMLLVSTGDGGSAWDPQDHGLDRASLLGKLLRLDIDRGWPYAIPEGNGFEVDRSARGEVHAIGLRNPWRFSIDRATGDIYIGDVGQDEWEEINVIRPGEKEVSFGWVDLDGKVCLPDRICEPGEHRTAAILYPHVEGTTGHCAVVGGYAYRGTAESLPQGTYLYGDYCSRTVWAVPADELVAGTAEPAVVGVIEPGLGLLRAFGDDDAGELYVLTSAGYVFAISAAVDPG